MSARNPLFEPIWFTPPDGSGFGLSKDSPSAPAPAPVPDPSASVLAQARALPSVYGPGGTSIYSGDPNVAGSFRRTDTLSPDQQRQFDAKNQINDQVLSRTNAAIGAMPTGPYAFDGATDPTTNKVYGAQETLLNRSFDRDRTQLEQRLANQGIPMGSEAWQREIEDFDRSKAASLTQAAAGSIQQGFSQDVATRQQNYNEVAAALGGSQLTPVGSGGNPVDVSSAFAAQQAGQRQQYQAGQDQYNAGVSQNNQLLSTAGTVAGMYFL